MTNNHRVFVSQNSCAHELATVTFTHVHDRNLQRFSALVPQTILMHTSLCIASKRRGQHLQRKQSVLRIATMLLPDSPHRGHRELNVLFWCSAGHGSAACFNSVASLAVFPQNWAVFSCVAGDFLLLLVAFFWASFIKAHAFFWAVFAKDFSFKDYSFCQFCWSSEVCFDLN